jgi:hypothetical protein
VYNHLYIFIVQYTPSHTAYIRTFALRVIVEYGRFAHCLSYHLHFLTYTYAFYTCTHIYSYIYCVYKECPCAHTPHIVLHTCPYAYNTHSHLYHIHLRMPHPYRSTCIDTRTASAYSYIRIDIYYTHLLPHTTHIHSYTLHALAHRHGRSHTQPPH